MMTNPARMTGDERWLASTWPFVREHLPPSGRVLEIGCGPLGGFVPALQAAGYDATGVDPNAPQGPDYRQTTFEQYEVTRPVDAIVACTSLHHVADLHDIVDRIAAALAPGGALLVVEWARERFDEATARWCFNRLTTSGEPGWLHRHQDQWHASGRSWDAYFEAWAQDEHLHTGHDIVSALETPWQDGARFTTRLLSTGPYFYADLEGVSAADEQAAIDSGQIQPTGIRYVGRLTTPTARPGLPTRRTRPGTTV